MPRPIARLLIAIASSVALLPASAKAQQAAPVAPQATGRLDEVVVTARRGEQALDDALPFTTLLSRSDIDAAQATDLVALLSHQAGVEMAQTGGPGAQASLFLRGANSTQVLVLIDGVRVNGAINGAALGGVNLDAVERIEIVRGNLSSLYGSEAIGGVIQIFTRGYRSGADGGGAGAEAGGYGQRAVQATVRTSVADTPITASFGARHLGGVSAIDPAAVRPNAFQPTATVNPDRDGVEQRSASLRAAHHAGEGADLAASLLHTDNRLRFDQVQATPDADEREHSRLDAWQAHWMQRWGERLSTRVAYGGSLQTSRDDVAVAGGTSSDSYRATNQQATLQTDLALVERMNLQVGVEALRQHGGATAYDPTGSGTRIDHDRDVRSAWIGTVGVFERNHLQLNVRRDDYNDVGGATTGLAACGRELVAGLRATAQVSTAFRVPSFNDLYYPFFGNPDLRPERARSLEFGLRYARDAERASVAIYRTLTRDLIAFDPATSRAENIARARLEGIEFAAATRHGPWQLGGSVTLGRAIDADTRLRLLRRAASVVNLDVAWEVGAVRLGAAFSRSAGRSDLDLNTFARKALPAYERTRLLAAWQFTRTLALRARIENLFDARTPLVDGYRTLGRLLAVGVQADW